MFARREASALSVSVFDHEAEPRPDHDSRCGGRYGALLGAARLGKHIHRDLDSDGALFNGTFKHFGLSLHSRR